MPGILVAVLGVLIVGDALDERGGAVTDADNGYVDLSGRVADAGCVV